MELAGTKGVDFRIAKQVRRSLVDCQAMYDILKEHAALGGKPVVVVKNGIRFTKCPPAYARGVYPGKSVGTSGGRR